MIHWIELTNFSSLHGLRVLSLHELGSLIFHNLDFTAIEFNSFLLCSVLEELLGVKLGVSFDVLIHLVSLFGLLDEVLVVLIMEDTVHVTTSKLELHCLLLMSGEARWEAVGLLIEE